MARVVLTFTDEEEGELGPRCHVEMQAEPPLNDPDVANTMAQMLAIKALAFLSTVSDADVDARASWGGVDDARPINLRPNDRQGW